jgi:uncharacterized membrane protein
MTLNITLLTRSRIYQSADFRLADPVTKRIVPRDSTKLVRVQYESFNGFITYTGVGSLYSKDTSAFLVDWLAGKENLTLDDFVRIVVDEGSSWLDRVNKIAGAPQPHTFVVVAFTGARPKIIIVSNVEDAAGRESSVPRGRLTETRIRARNRSLAVITGKKAAVTRQRKRSLERLADVYPDDSARIRHAMVSLNRAAAQSPKAGNAVSEECTVISVDVSGQGFQEISPERRVEVRSIAYGLQLPDLTKVARELGIRRPRLVGASFGSSRQQAAQPIICHPSIVVPPGSKYELVELSRDSFYSTLARAIGDDGSILGAGTTFERRGDHRYCIWTPEGDGSELPFVGQNDIGMDLVSPARAALTAVLDGSLRAIRWDGTGGTDLGAYQGRDSGAKKLNAEGTIAGWVCIDLEQRGQDHYRPCIWLKDNSLHVLEDLGGWTWGTGVDLNTAGTVLIWLHKKGATSAHLWSHEGALTQVSQGSPAAVIPMGLNDRGDVLGFVNDNNYRPTALISRQGAAWQLLGTKPGMYPTAIGEDSSVIGSVRQDGFERPWLSLPSGEIIELPSLRYHHCRPMAINSQGDIVGDGSTDHGSHALLWRLRSRA